MYFWHYIQLLTHYTHLLVFFKSDVYVFIVCSVILRMKSNLFVQSITGVCTWVVSNNGKIFFFIQQLRAVSVERGGRLGICPCPFISWQLTALLNSWDAWKNISRQCFTHIHVYTLTHSQLTRQWTSHSSQYKEKVTKISVFGLGLSRLIDKKKSLVAYEWWNNVINKLYLKHTLLSKDDRYHKYRSVSISKL